MSNFRNSRRFLDPDVFDSGQDKYFLLPFRFMVIGDQEILVNEIGDYLTAPRGTAEALAKHELKPTDVLYPDLVSEFFISEKPLPDLIDVLATRYRTKRAFMEHFTSLHIFVTTLRCNQSCHYCQVSRQTQDKGQYDMSRQHLDMAIEHMFRSPSPDLTMEFQGGEPLLAFELIRYGVLSAQDMNKRYRKNLSFVICTNLLMVDDQILSFCKEHEILLSTSLDGPDQLHDENRPWHRSGSASIFRERLEYAREWLGHDRISALMTTSRKSLEMPSAIIDSYLDSGFDGIFLRPISPYGFARKSLSKNDYETSSFLEFYFDALDYIIDINKAGRFFREDYAAILLRKMLTPFPVGYVDLQSPAGLVTSVAVYNYDGKVYASDEARMLAEQGDEHFCLGHVSQSYDDVFLTERTRKLCEDGINEALAGCSECAFQAYCGADPVFHYATQGDPAGYRPTSSFCRRNMAIIKHLIKLIERDMETASILRRWAAS